MRPLVVVSAAEQIDESDEVVCVAITGTIPRILPESYVELPYSNDRPHPKTGLTKRSAAICTWLETVRKENVLRERGQCPIRHLCEILQKIDGLPPHE